MHDCKRTVSCGKVVSEQHDLGERNAASKVYFDKILHEIPSSGDQQAHEI